MPRVALIQHPPAFLDRAATLDRAVTAVDEAARGGAQLIVFPEAYVSGYPAWIWRLRPGGDMALTEQLCALLRASAVDLDADDLGRCARPPSAIQSRSYAASTSATAGSAAARSTTRW